MNKLEFIAELRDRLSGLPQGEVEERLSFYSEMIDDRMEDGVSEEEAVLAVGAVDEIAKQIISDFPLYKIAKERIKPKRRLKVWEYVLLVLGSPMCLTLLAAAVIVAVSLYAVVWVVIVSLWAVFGSVVGCAIGGVVGGICCAFGGNAATSCALIGAGLVCAGLSILLFFAFKLATKGVLLLSKKIALCIKRSFMKKEEA